jgi:hypothetical protein
VRTYPPPTRISCTRITTHIAPRLRVPV